MSLSKATAFEEAPNPDDRPLFHHEEMSHLTEVSTASCRSHQRGPNIHPEQVTVFPSNTHKNITLHNKEQILHPTLAIKAPHSKPAFDTRVPLLLKRHIRRIKPTPHHLRRIDIKG